MGPPCPELCFEDYPGAVARDGQWRQTFFRGSEMRALWERGQGSPEPSLRGPVDEKGSFLFSGELVRQVVGWLNLRHSGPLTGVAIFP